MKNNIKTLLLFVAFISISSSAWAAPLFFGFEGESIGAQPAGWISPYGSTVGGGGSISSQQASGGSQSMLVSGQGGAAKSVGRPGSFSTDNNRLLIDLYAPGTNGISGTNFFIGIYGGFRFDLYQNGTANTVDLNLFDGNRITGLARDTWHTVQFNFDWTNGVVDAFLNGSIVANGVSFAPNLGGGPSSDLTFQGMHSHGAGGVAGHTFVDNILLYQSASVPEPHVNYLLLLGLFGILISRTKTQVPSRLET